MQAEDYARKLRFEQQHFQDQEEVHALPEIFHYWSNQYVLPMLQSCGFVNDEDMYAQYLRRAADACGEAVPRFISIGAGNGDLEVRVAERLRREGLREFVFECLEMTPAMLERGRELAREAGLQHHVQMVEGDFNRWSPAHRYTGIIANQALHHVVELERLFDEIQRVLDPRGYFLTNDMIGRNGHMRWPEALEAMRPFWLELPVSYRWNRPFRRHEEEYINHDCSTEGFEGIRAQEILPLLVERFQFPVFAAFGNIVNVFVDRVFGHNFDAKGAWDRDFVDRVHAADEAGIQAGTLSPTQMFAVMTTGETAETRHARGLSPRHCIRKEPGARVAGGGTDGFPAPEALRWETTSLRPTGDWGVEFGQQLRVSGGRAPYQFEAAALAPGLTLSREGYLAGAVQGAGIHSNRIVVRDSSTPPLVEEQCYTLVVKAEESRRPLSLPTGIAFAAGIRGQSYRQPLDAQGGVAPFRWELAQGRLPQGIVLDPQRGELNGKPARDGVFSFTLRVSDAAGESAVTTVLLPVSRTAETRRLALPLLMMGGGWSTVLQLSNPTPAPATVSMHFLGSGGELLERPLHVTMPDGTQGEPVHRELHRELAPFASLRVAALEGGDEMAGWVTVTCQGGVTGNAELRRADGEWLLLPLDGSPESSILLPFRNGDGARTMVAAASLPGGGAKTLSVRVWDGTWRWMDGVVVPLGAGTQSRFYLDEVVPLSAGASGFVELEARGSLLSAVGLRVRPDGRFSALPRLSRR